MTTTEIIGWIFVAILMGSSLVFAIYELKHAPTAEEDEEGNIIRFVMEDEETSDDEAQRGNFNKQQQNQQQKPAKKILSGIIGIAEAGILAIVNLFIHLGKRLTHLIKTHPVAAVVVTFMIMTAICIGIYASSRAKIVNAEHERSMLELKLDSVNEARNTAGYSYSRKGNFTEKELEQIARMRGE